MSLETFLNLFGLAISLGGLVAARLTKQVMLAVFASALIGIMGVSVWRNYEHSREVSKVENELKQRLAHNRWTLEQVRSEMRDPDYKILREALIRTIENGIIGDRKTECTVNDGSVLSTRVYFTMAP